MLVDPTEMAEEVGAIVHGKNYRVEKALESLEHKCEKFGISPEDLICACFFGYNIGFNNDCCSEDMFWLDCSDQEFYESLELFLESNKNRYIFWSNKCDTLFVGENAKDLSAKIRAFGDSAEEARNILAEEGALEDN